MERWMQLVSHNLQLPSPERFLDIHSIISEFARSEYGEPHYLSIGWPHRSILWKGPAAGNDVIEIIAHSKYPWAKPQIVAMQSTVLSKTPCTRLERECLTQSCCSIVSNCHISITSDRLTRRESSDATYRCWSILMPRAVTRNMDNELRISKSFHFEDSLVRLTATPISQLTCLIPIGGGWLSQDIAKWIAPFRTA